VVPDAIEQLLLGIHDLVQAPWLLDEVALGKQLLDLRPKMFEQDTVESVDPKHVRRPVSRKNCIDVGRRLPLVPIRQREVIAVRRDEHVRLARKIGSVERSGIYLNKQCICNAVARPMKRRQLCKATFNHSTAVNIRWRDDSPSPQQLENFVEVACRHRADQWHVASKILDDLERVLIIRRAIVIEVLPD
jgi:hypothetical protein